MDIDQVTLDGDTEKSLSGLSGDMKSGGDLLLRLTRDVIEPSDSGGLVEFIGFSGGHRIDIDICPATGQMLDEARLCSRLVSIWLFHFIPLTPKHD
jgi:hypothetical protein